MDLGGDEPVELDLEASPKVRGYASLEGFQGHGVGEGVGSASAHGDRDHAQLPPPPRTTHEPLIRAQTASEPVES